MKYDYSQIEDAFDFVKSAPQFEHDAVLDLETGEMYYQSDNMDEEFPDDVDSARYLSIPHMDDLLPGSRRVFRFAAEVVPDHEAKIREIFQSRGAFRRFKDFLDGVGKLEAWYDYERKALGNFIREWCEENGLELK